MRAETLQQRIRHTGEGLHANNLQPINKPFNLPFAELGKPFFVSFIQFLNYFPMSTFVRANATQYTRPLKFCNRARHGTSFHSKHIRHLLRSYKRIRTN